VLVAISNVERMLGDEGDAKIRELAIRAALDSYERQGRDEDYVMGIMGLALLKDETGDVAGATGCYRDAVIRAAAMKNPALRSQVLRNFGLMLSSRAKKTGAPDQLAEAEARLTEAVMEAARSDHVEMLGRAEIALGLFFQHGGRLGEAKPFIERGLEHLDAAHPDAVCGRSHLQAILSGGSCGCGDTPAAIADAFRDFVLGRLPPGLLKDLKVTLKDTMDFDVKVELNREPTEPEIEQLDRVINHSLEEFRRRLRREY
jgi:hypothetical protein